jgi:DnaJ-class molecular chaperone
MPPQYYVSEKVPCPNCDGKGEWPSNYWRLFWIWCKSWLDTKKTMPSPEACTTWWANQGYPDMSKLPREIETCGECKGSGEVYRIAPLAEALRQISFMPHAPNDSGDDDNSMPY